MCRFSVPRTRDPQLDGFFWNENLPDSIEAILGEPGDPQALQLHTAFLSAYSLSAEQVPLLSFHKERQDAPFVVESGSRAGQSYSSYPQTTSSVAGNEPMHTGDISSLGYGR